MLSLVILDIQAQILQLLQFKKRVNLDLKMGDAAMIFVSSTFPSLLKECYSI